jgi:hypothetical protein
VLRLGFEFGGLEPVVRAVVGDRAFAQEPGEDGEPLLGARVAGVVDVEGRAVLRGLLAPPGGDDVERDAAGRDGLERERAFAVAAGGW